MFCSVLVACSSGVSPVDAPDDLPPLEAEAMAAEPVDDRPPPGVLWRHEVVETVDAGLGYFLQRVSVEPALEQGRFTGFRIVELRPHNWWAGVDLRLGDVVEKINEMPIERETEAFKAFESLRTAKQLSVSLVREGESRTLVFEIKDQPGHQSPKPKKPSPGAVPSASPEGKQSAGFAVPRQSRQSL